MAGLMFSAFMIVFYPTQRSSLLQLDKTVWCSSDFDYELTMMLTLRHPQPGSAKEVMMHCNDG
jgi:hypothetical protein